MLAPMDISQPIEVLFEQFDYYHIFVNAWDFRYSDKQLILNTFDLFYQTGTYPDTCTIQLNLLPPPPTMGRIVDVSPSLVD